MAISKSKKTDIISTYKGLISDSNAIFFINSQNVKTEEILNLKKKLKNLNCTYKLIKNSLFAKSYEGKNSAIILSKLFGYNAAVFCFEDPSPVAKEIASFIKVNKQVKVNFGLLEETVLESTEVERIAILPSKLEMIQQIQSMLNNSLGRAVSDLRSPLSQLITTLNQIHTN